MKKIYVTVESSQGRILAQSESAKEKITIGSGSKSTLCLADEKLAALECEVYLLNDECWLQVSKEGSAVSFKGKQFRTLKIEESSILYLKNLVLKIDFEKLQESDIEKTRVLSGLDLVQPRKTEDQQFGSALEMTKAEPEPTKTDLEISEKTRVVPVDMEQTRVVRADSEATRIISADSEKTRFVSISEKMDQSLDQAKSVVITEQDIFGVDEKKASFNIKDYFENKNFTIKEVSLIALTLLITLGIGKWLLFSSTKAPVNLELVALEQQNKLLLSDPQRHLVPSSNTPQAQSSAEVVPTTRVEYLRSLSSLFDKH